MPSINLGKVVGDKGTSIRNRGAWNPTAQYLNDEHFVDFVTHKGSLWMCAQTNSDSEPSADNAGWTLALSSIDTVYFEQAEERGNIESGERVSISFGKIAKIFSDLLSGAASTLLGEVLTKNRVLVSDASGKVAVSDITTTILNYLSGLIGNVQEQLNKKINASKIVESAEITETGFLMDGKIVADKLAELNGNFEAMGGLKRAYIKKSVALVKGVTTVISAQELADIGITDPWNQVMAICGRIGTVAFPITAITTTGVADAGFRVNIYIDTASKSIRAASADVWSSRLATFVIDYIDL